MNKHKDAHMRVIMGMKRAHVRTCVYVHKIYFDLFIPICCNT